jgi:AraC family transcriptional regulator
MNKEEFLLDNFLYSNKEINFYEKLYSHDTSVSPLLFKLRRLSNNFKDELPAIEETFHLLLLKLLDKQTDIEKEVRKIKATKKSTKQELYKRLNRAKDLIDSCYYENLSLSNIASTCLLNETYLLRQFRTYFGITPRQYVIQKRMEAARQFVECDYDLSISEICLRVGYSDLTSFSKLYKKIYSYSPENYRGLYR